MPEPKSCIAAALSDAGKAVVFLACAAASLWGLYRYLPVYLLPLPYYAWVFVFSLCGLAAALAANVLCMGLFERTSVVNIGLRWNGRNLLIGLAGGASSALLVTVVPVLLGAAEFKPASTPMANANDLALFAALFLAATLYEELAMRGYLLQALMLAFGLPAAAIFTALLFAAGHLLNRGVSPFAMANTFLAGVILAVCFRAAGDLWFPIGLHYAWNMTVVLLGARVSGFLGNRMTNVELVWKSDPVWSGGSYGPEAGVLTTLAFGLWLLWAWKAPLHRREPWMLAKR